MKSFMILYISETSLVQFKMRAEIAKNADDDHSEIIIFFVHMMIGKIQ